MPDEAIDAWEAELAQEDDKTRVRELNRRIERFADAGHGSCVLRDPRAARIVQEVLFHDHRDEYDLLAWAIMPNHVHVVLEPLGDHRLSKIVQALKGVSSKGMGKLNGTRGRLWQPDYFDRLIRDDGHLERVVRYLEWNPVKAGLCWEPKGWHWSSANPDARKRLGISADQGSAHR